VLAAGIVAAVLTVGGTWAGLALTDPPADDIAATVGNDHITVASLNAQVSSLQTAIKPYGTSLLPAAQMPAMLLSWLIRFQVMDQVAAANGISVTTSQGQAEQGLTPDC
jgi:hypothetical protein